MYGRDLFARWTILTLVVLLAGCGGGDGPELATVSGTVTLDGEPLGDAMVMFLPEQGRPSVAQTDADGEYELQYTDDEGAMIGMHTVRISTYRAPYVDETDGTETPGAPEHVPTKYNVATTLSKEVVPGHNEINFELDTDGEIVQPAEERPEAAADY